MMDAICLLGPTACGKTDLAIQFALKVPSEIISVDSALVYRGMDIGTAKPTLQERKGVPHHLIDIRDPFDSYSAADFAGDAAALIKDIRSRGRVPLLAGGTMLYAKALFDGIDDIPGSDPRIREKVESEASSAGWPAMHEKLARFDPMTAARLSPNDSQRISRALEVYEMTGRPISSFQKGGRGSEFNILKVALMPPDRGKLHERIAKRFEAMLEKGFLDEVRALMKRPDFDSDAPSMRSVGYRQAVSYLSGAISKEQFVKDACTATRRLAKRQITWLRSMPGLYYLDPEDSGTAQFFYELCMRALENEWMS